MSQKSTAANVKVFGFWTATSLVLGNMIGSGVFFLPASLAQYGSISILGWLVTAIGATSLAYVFAVMSRRHPDAGGPYTHTRRVFGDFLGFLMAWGYWITSWSSNAAISLAFASYLSHFSPPLAASKGLTFLTASSLIWLTTLLNCSGLRNVGFVQNLTVIIKLSPLILVGVVGPFYIDFHNFWPLKVSGDLSSFQSITMASSLTLWAFMGLEAATVPAKNVANPKHTIARATLFGTSLGAVIYVVITVVLFGLISTPELSHSSAPFVEAAIRLFGPTIAPIIGFCVLVSIFGGLNGWIMFQGQIPLAMANDGFFPKIFAWTSSKGIPVFGLIFSSILTTLLLSFDLDSNLVEQFNTIILVGCVMALFTYLFTALAALKTDLEQKKLQGGLIFATIIGSAYSLWAILGSGSQNLMICAIGYLCGLPVYWYCQGQRRVIPVG
ncbi:amino acid permease [Candidatus Paracaedibacter symbiosus]|uniref:amino acid permease n=1 Tax=Candidatus Paracaedibacter symbiosus TaxID=244582 RepID=UPI00068BF567|nr:amino acid permease [Candidatus Paracaedibacter symbiosus]